MVARSRIRAGSREGTAAALAILLVLTTLALVLRVRGGDFMLPHMPEPDAHIVRQVELFDLERSEAARDVNFGKYPHLIARLLHVWPWHRLEDAARGDAPLSEHLVRASHAYVRARTAVMLLSVLLVPATFLLARRFVGPGGASFAAFLSATSLLHMQFSQQARPHAPAAAFITLAVVAAIGMRRRPAWASYAVAAGIAFLAVGTLQTGLAVLLPLAAAHLARARTVEGGSRASALWILLPLLAVALSLATLSPFLFAESVGKDGGQLQLESGGILQSGHVIIFSWFTDRGFARVLHTFWSYEPVTLVLAGLGLVAWIASGSPAGRDAGAGSRRDLWVVLAFVLPYLLVLGAYARTYERLVMPLVPFGACLAGAGLERSVAFARRFRAGWVLALVGCAAVILWPAVAAWRFATLRALPDTATEAAAWIAENVAPEETVYLPRALSLPLLGDAESNEGNRRLLRSRLPTWVGYQLSADLGGTDVARYGLHWLPVGTRRQVEAVMSDARGFVLGLGADYMVLEDYSQRRRDPLMTLVYEAVRAEGELVARFAPDPSEDGPLHPFTFQDEPTGEVPHFTRRVLTARRVGPILEIYRLSAVR